MKQPVVGSHLCVYLIPQPFSSCHCHDVIAFDLIFHIIVMSSTMMSYQCYDVISMLWRHINVMTSYQCYDVISMLWRHINVMTTYQRYDVTIEYQNCMQLRSENFLHIVLNPRLTEMDLCSTNYYWRVWNSILALIGKIALNFARIYY
jgi:hypothetical protein